MVIENGRKTSANDDAHFITFNTKGCYASDMSGNTIGGGLLKFIKHENGLHCYSGMVNGVNSDIFFSSDYSRINIKSGSTTYVYQRESGNTTSASMRGQTNTQSSGSGMMPVYPVMNTNLGSGTQTTRRTCPGCHGTGIGYDKKYYRPDYTGHQINEYCSICGEVAQPHSHQKVTCTVCRGRGYIE